MAITLGMTNGAHIAVATSLPITININAGDTVLVFAGAQASTTLTVTDNASPPNVYTLLAAFGMGTGVSGPPSGMYGALYRSEISNARPATQITITPAQTSIRMLATVSTWQNVVSLGAVDLTSVVLSTTSFSRTIQLTQANNIHLFGLFQGTMIQPTNPQFSSGTTVGSNWGGGNFGIQAVQNTGLAGANTIAGTLTNTGVSNPAGISVELQAAVAGSFSLSLSSSTLNVPQGSSGSVTATINAIGGFSSPVSFSIAGLPSGVSGFFNPNPATGSSVLTLTALGSATPGPANLTITGTSGTLSYDVPLTLTVVASSFSLTASPSSLSINQGASGQSTITVVPSGIFSGAVTLSVTAVGMTAQFTPNPTTGSSVMLLTVAANATIGTFTVYVGGTSGLLSANVPISVTINAYVPPPVGVNDLSTRQWTLAAPAPFSTPNSILWYGNIYIRGLIFSGYTSPGDVCVLKDRFGRTIWSATGSTGMQPVWQGKVGWVEGLVLDQLGSGICMVYIK